MRVSAVNGVHLKCGEHIPVDVEFRLQCQRSTVILESHPTAGLAAEVQERRPVTEEKVVDVAELQELGWIPGCRRQVIVQVDQSLVPRSGVFVELPGAFLVALNDRPQGSRFSTCSYPEFLS